MSSKGITKLCTHLHPHPPSSLQHPQRYLNQNIAAHNWAISPNLGRKTNCPFWLKIGTHDIVEVLIPNPELLEFWNPAPKSIFGKIWAQKFKVVCLKIGAHSISRMLIPNPDLDFWNFDPKIHFWANLGPKSHICLFFLKIGTHGISRMLNLIATIVFWISNLNSLFGQICMPTVCQH